MLTGEFLRSHLDYCPDTGIFSRGSKPAGFLDKKGYVRIAIKGKQYRAHRLAWLYIYDVEPRHQIDHINGVRHDNRVANLREATSQQNNQNRRARPTKSGFKGVYKQTRGNCWFAKIVVNYKQIFLGNFSSPQEAHRAYVQAAALYCGEFANV